MKRIVTRYLVKKDNMYLYKVKDNGYGYFSSKNRAMTFSKSKAIELAKQYGGEVEEKNESNND